MSKDDWRRVYDSGEDQVHRRDDIRVIPFSHGGVVDCADIPGRSSLPPLCPLPSGEAASAPVSVAKYISIFKSFLDSRRFAFVHQDGKKLDIIDAARCAGTHDTALSSCP